MPALIHSKITLLIAIVLVTGAAHSTALAQEPLLVPSGVEILTLDRAIDVALQNNRSAKNARLEADKADDRTAAARTHLLPGFKLNTGISQPLSAFDTT